MAQDAPDTPRPAMRSEATTTRQEVRPAGAKGVHTQAALVVLAGWEIGREIQLRGDEVVIGRSMGADLEIPDPTISRRHARVVHARIDDRDHYEISDLGSSNGLFVNGHRVDVAQLVDGDRLKIGDVILKFVVRDELEGEFFKQVHRRIHYDQLTGLLKFDSFLHALHAEIARDRGGFTLAMTDMDGLKRVNDTYGHLAGRAVVREMGVMFREVLRPEDVAGLYGGDEAVILYPCTPLSAAREVADTLRQTVAARRIRSGDHVCSVTISQGLAEWPRHGRTDEELIAAADRALYRAKADGRDCVREADTGDSTAGHTSATVPCDDER
jgi:diguanylate cyclase (GGDEF)-like protein